MSACCVGLLVMLPGLLALHDAEHGGQSPEWLQVSEKTACEAMQDDFCLGRYGFAIRSDGRFTAGPSGSGHVIDGQIEQPELTRLSKLIVHLSPTGAAQQRSNESHAIPGVRDQVDVSFAGLPTLRIYDQGTMPGQIRYLGSWDAVREFHQYLRKLLARYYPVPFPGH